MRVTRHHILLLLLTAMLSAPLGMSAVATADRDTDYSDATLTVDTLETEDNPFRTASGNAKRQPVDSARIAGLTDYASLLNAPRTRTAGEAHDRRWYRNAFYEIGGGIARLTPPSADYRFTPLITMRLALGAQLGDYHRLRITAQGATANLTGGGPSLLRGGLALEHSFDFSAYLAGYDSRRPISIRSLLGLGAQHSLMSDRNLQGTSAEGHAGLQLALMAGAYSHINIEPYVGIASDQADLSNQRNWRNFDFFYGANLSFVYYFNSHLSDAARRWQIAHRSKGNTLYADSTLLTWKRPWFWQLAAGPWQSAMPRLAGRDTRGHGISLSTGRWLSTVGGLQATIHTRHTDWLREQEESYGVDYEQRFTMRYAGARLEALINPIGLSNHFNWNSKAGIHFSAGGEYGLFYRRYKDVLYKKGTYGYTAAAHLWVSLTPGLQVYIEPRYAHHLYSNTDDSQQQGGFAHDSYGIEIGLTATNLHQLHDYEGHAMLPPFVLGVGGGTNSAHVSNGYVGEYKLHLNVLATAEYRFNPVSSARFDFQYFTMSKSNVAAYNDYDMLYPQPLFTRYPRYGLWRHTYYMALTSLNYGLSLTNLLSGYNPRRRFELQVFAGPGIAWLFGQKARLSTLVTTEQGHMQRLDDPVSRGGYAAANIAAKFSTRISPAISLALTPRLTYIHDIDLQAVKLYGQRTIESCDIGIEWNISDEILQTIRQRQIARRKRSNTLFSDSTLQSWQRPWLVDFSAAAYVAESSELTYRQTLGHSIAAGLGKWLSPFIGLKVTAQSRVTTSGHHTVTISGIDYERNLNTLYLSGRLEAMINPFGLTSNYNWNSRAGLYLTGGAEYGKLIKQQQANSMGTPSWAYCAGAHFWVAIAPGLQLFVEPRLAHNVYRLVYRNTNWKYSVVENSYGIHLGITATSIRTESQRAATESPSLAARIARSPISIGLAGGTNLTQVYSKYNGDRRLPLNMLATVEYRFNPYSSVRLAAEYLTHSKSDYARCNIYDMEYPQPAFTRITRNAQWLHTYFIGVAALNYGLSLSQLMARHNRQRTFELQVYAGPAMAYLFGQEARLSHRERLSQRYQAHLDDPVRRGAYFALNGAVKLAAHITPHLQLTITPQLTYIPKIDLQAIKLQKLSYLESLNVGLQWNP